MRYKTIQMLAAFLLSVALIGTLTGCFDKEAPSTAPNEQVTDPVKSTTIPPSIASGHEVVEQITWMFDGATGTLTFSGMGPLAAEEAETADTISYDWHTMKRQVRSVVVKEGITRIPNYAFYDFAEIEEVSLPSTLTSIGDYAFCHCSFSEITIPLALEELGTGAFSHCGLLRFCDLLYTEVTVLPAALFEECTGLQYISLPGVAERLEETCLYGCDQISSLLLPASVTSIGELYANIEVFVFQGEPPELPWNSDTGECLLFYGDVTVYYPAGSTAWRELAARCTQEGVTWVEGIPSDGA